MSTFEQGTAAALARAEAAETALTQAERYGRLADHALTAVENRLAQTEQMLADAEQALADERAEREQAVVDAYERGTMHGQAWR